MRKKSTKMSLRNCQIINQHLPALQFFISYNKRFILTNVEINLWLALTKKKTHFFSHLNWNEHNKNQNTQPVICLVKQSFSHAGKPRTNKKKKKKKKIKLIRGEKLLKQRLMRLYPTNSIGSKAVTVIVLLWIE